MGIFSSLRRRQQGVISLLVRAEELRWSIVDQIIVGGANLVVSIIIARGLGVVAFGRYSIAFLIILLFRNLFESVILSPMAVLIPKMGKRALPFYRSALICFCAVFTGAGIVFLYGGLLAVNAVYKVLWLQGLIIPLSIAIVGYLLPDLLRRYFYVCGSFRKSLVLDSLRSALSIVTLYMVLSGSGSRLDIALYAVGVGGIAASLVFLAALWPLGWWTKVAAISAIRHYRIARWTIPSIFLSYSQTSVPFFIGAGVVGIAEVGGLRAVNQLAMTAGILVYAYQNIIPIRAARKYKVSGKSAMMSYLGRATAFGIVINALIIFVLIASAYVLIESHMAPNMKALQSIFCPSCCAIFWCF